MQTWIALRRSLAIGIPRSKTGRRILSWACLLFGFLAACEFGGRMLGLHTPVLYEATSYGYRVKPHQDIQRFGNRIVYDVHGLRSAGVAAQPAADTLRILCLGDSITNGASVTDQAYTYPNLLQERLRARGLRAEVLNASAPGWAIANEAGWLRANGTYGAQVVMLTIGTTDLSQAMATAQILDHHPSFPSRAPALALEELWLRYLKPYLLRESLADPGVDDPAEVRMLPNRAIANTLWIAEMARQQGALPVVMFVEQPFPPDAELAAARSMLFKALKAHQIAFVDTRAKVEQSGGLALFRDGLHPNVAGNRVLAQVAAQLVAPAIVEVSHAVK